MRADIRQCPLDEARSDPPAIERRRNFSMREDDPLAIIPIGGDRSRAIDRQFVAVLSRIVGDLFDHLYSLAEWSRTTLNARRGT